MEYPVTVNSILIAYLYLPTIEDHVDGTSLLV